jgi:hypothetical protein
VLLGIGVMFALDVNATASSGMGPEEYHGGGEVALMDKVPPGKIPDISFQVTRGRARQQGDRM